VRRADEAVRQQAGAAQPGPDPCHLASGAKTYKKRSNLFKRGGRLQDLRPQRVGRWVVQAQQQVIEAHPSMQQASQVVD
jgi:hypothetical protein